MCKEVGGMAATHAEYKQLQGCQTDRRRPEQAPGLCSVLGGSEWAVADWRR